MAALSNNRISEQSVTGFRCQLVTFNDQFFCSLISIIISLFPFEMAFEVLFKIVYYVSHVIKGLLEIAIGKEEFIYDDQGNVISRLPSKRKQVLVFAKNFFKEPVSSSFASSAK